MSDKPNLVLMEGREITFDKVMAMFSKLVGRDPTEEETAEARRFWEEEANKSETPPGRTPNPTLKLLREGKPIGFIIAGPPSFRKPPSP
jgi:hypothetical protein